MAARRRDDLPSGMVTFLFSDIEGSTRLLHDIGPHGYAQALAEHRRTLRAAFAAHHGQEVDTEGDAFLVVFREAPDAIAAAAEIQHELESGPIRVRVGIHTGTPLLGDEGYVGADVHKGARIAAAAHGGQIVLSRETRDLLIDNAELLDLGEHKVKDFSEPVWLFQWGHERFPLLRTIANTNLPRPTSSFVGRVHEVARISALLTDSARLITLTGPGGTGKSRLAIEAAAEVVPAFPNGVFWIPLAGLRDATLVDETIGRALGAKDSLADHIGGRHMLLVLDNLEQILAAAPGLASLVETCPGLRILATSRERMRVRGEVEFVVPPLAPSDATALFCDRAQLAADETITELCRRLDDLPLAVELAAARTSALSPDQILDRLGQRLDVLKGGRDADARQATLRATIQWSYDLLARNEQTLLARLAVFRDGFTLEAAESVCDADIDTLASLVDKSLLRQRDERFSMLETLLEFALERLDESGEAAERRRRHADHFQALAAAAESHLRFDDISWLDRLEHDRDNLRAALDRLEDLGDTQAVLGMAGALHRFWYLKSHLTEGRRRLERALAADSRATAQRAIAVRGAAVMALNLTDTNAALAWAEESLVIERLLGNEWGQAYARMMIGNSLAEDHQLAAALPSLEQAAAEFERLGDELYVCVVIVNLGWVADELGDHARGRLLHADLLRRARDGGFERLEAAALEQLGIYALEDGQDSEALSMLRAATSLERRRGQTQDAVHNLRRVADVYARAGRPADAARLLGSWAGQLEDLGWGTPWWGRVRGEETLAHVREQLGEEELRQALDEGRRLSLDGALAIALGDEPDSSGNLPFKSVASRRPR